MPGKLKQRCDECEPCSQDCCCRAIDFCATVIKGGCAPLDAEPETSCRKIVGLRVGWAAPAQCILDRAEGEPLRYEVFLPEPLAGCDGSGRVILTVEAVTTARACDSSEEPIARDEMWPRDPGDPDLCIRAIGKLCLRIYAADVLLATCVLCLDDGDEPCDDDDTSVSEDSFSSSESSSSESESGSDSASGSDDSGGGGSGGSGGSGSGSGGGDPPDPPGDDDSSGSSSSGSESDDGCCTITVDGFAGGPCDVPGGETVGTITIYGSVSISCACGCTNGTGTLTIGGSSFPFSGFGYAESATLPCVAGGGTITVSASWGCADDDCPNCDSPPSVTSICVPVDGVTPPFPC